MFLKLNHHLVAGMSFAVHHFEIETNWNSSELPGKLEVFMCKIRRGRG